MAAGARATDDAAEPGVRTDEDRAQGAGLVRVAAAASLAQLS
ncbi:hypothetical protein [Streptomyces sp. G-G2]|nr:hypothetical protein [Streptomyces sp. G-G2]MDJ0386223.1 hypothetical protein [Streptomyces sp. G-G2]